MGLWGIHDYTLAYWCPVIWHRLKMRHNQGAISHVLKTVHFMWALKALGLRSLWSTVNQVETLLISLLWMEILWYVCVHTLTSIIYNLSHILLTFTRYDVMEWNEDYILTFALTWSTKISNLMQNEEWNESLRAISRIHSQNYFWVNIYLTLNHLISLSQCRLECYFTRTTSKQSLILSRFAISCTTVWFLYHTALFWNNVGESLQHSCSAIVNDILSYCKNFSYLIGILLILYPSFILQQFKFKIKFFNNTQL